MSKILVSMIAYRERYLAESVRDCYEKSSNPENLIFSIVAEQSTESLHADLSFIPGSQLIYRKYDLSEYRGVLWSRAKTADVNIEYDYILYTCGHNLFVPNWDVVVIEEYGKALKKYPKPVITVSGPEYEMSAAGEVLYQSRAGRVTNYYRPQIDKEYIPGYGFPLAEVVPDSNDVLEDFYWQGSWVFGPKAYVDEVPLNPNINYHAEEIYTTIQTWGRGWRLFSTPKVLYYHDTYKEYPGELLPRSTTHRPWSDMNKAAFWAQSEETLTELNLLLSGRLDGKFGGISPDIILDYCMASGMNARWCAYDPKYGILDLPRHGDYFIDKEPYTEDNIDR
jgi:hypothetical protein